MRIADCISQKNPLQKKKIANYLLIKDRAYWEEADSIAHALNISLLSEDAQLHKAADSYHRMCMDFLREQIQFQKTRAYRVQDQGEALKGVYHNPDVMRYYMEGLLISYLFWPNHFAILRFLIEHLKEIEVRRCLEVGVGHGLFSSEVLKRFPKARVTAVDISETSLQVAQEMMLALGGDLSRVVFEHGDFVKWEASEPKFDFILMGEVLEHVDNAPVFLEKARTLLTEEGTLFLTTCANCPAIDHVYHFHSVTEIRSVIQGAGFKIHREMALPSDPIPEKDWEESLVTLNYFAILSKNP